MPTPARKPLLLGRATIAVLFVTILIAGCSGSSRPSVGEWRAEWLGVVEGLPDLVQLSGSESQELCADALAVLRSSSGELSPTPDLAVDDTVRQWIEVAEDTFFECPPRSGEIDSFARAYEELDRLQAEVAVVLELDE